MEENKPIQNLEVEQNETSPSREDVMPPNNEQQLNNPSTDEAIVAAIVGRKNEFYTIFLRNIK